MGWLKRTLPLKLCHRCQDMTDMNFRLFSVPGTSLHSPVKLYKLFDFLACGATDFKSRLLLISCRAWKYAGMQPLNTHHNTRIE